MEKENLLAKTKQELIDLREYKVRRISNQLLTKNAEFLKITTDMHRLFEEFFPINICC